VSPAAKSEVGRRQVDRLSCQSAASRRVASRRFYFCARFTRNSDRPLLCNGSARYNTTRHSVQVPLRRYHLSVVHTSHAMYVLTFSEQPTKPRGRRGTLTFLSARRGAARRIEVADAWKNRVRASLPALRSTNAERSETQPQTSERICGY